MEVKEKKYVLMIMIFHLLSTTVMSDLPSVHGPSWLVLPEWFLCYGLILRVVVLLQVRVGQRLLHHDPLVGIECEHPLQQVQGLAVCIGVKFFPGDFGFIGQGLDIAARLLIDDTVEVLLAGGAKDGQDVVELVQVMLPGEYWPVGQHLSQDTTHGPDVDRLGVALGVEHDLRGAIPARGHVF